MYEAEGCKEEVEVFSLARRGNHGDREAGGGTEVSRGEAEKQRGGVFLASEKEVTTLIF